MSGVTTVAVIGRSRAVSASEDSTLRVWNLETGTTLYRLKGHTEPVWAMVITAGEDRAISASQDGTLRVWNLDTGQLLSTLEGHTGSVSALAVTTDGRRAVSASRDSTLRIWDLESSKQIAAFTGNGEIRSCAFAPNGRTIIGGDASGRVHFLRLVEADPTKPAPNETKIQLLHSRGTS